MEPIDFIHKSKEDGEGIDYEATVRVMMDKLNHLEAYVEMIAGRLNKAAQKAEDMAREMDED